MIQRPELYRRESCAVASALLAPRAQTHFNAALTVGRPFGVVDDEDEGAAPVRQRIRAVIPFDVHVPAACRDCGTKRKPEPAREYIWQ